MRILPLLFVATILSSASVYAAPNSADAGFNAAVNYIASTKAAFTTVNEVVKNFRDAHVDAATLQMQEVVDATMVAHRQLRVLRREFTPKQDQAFVAQAATQLQGLQLQELPYAPELQRSRLSFYLAQESAHLVLPGLVLSATTPWVSDQDTPISRVHQSVRRLWAIADVLHGVKNLEQAKAVLPSIKTQFDANVAAYHKNQKYLESIDTDKRAAFEKRHSELTLFPVAVVKDELQRIRAIRGVPSEMKRLGLRL